MVDISRHRRIELAKSMQIGRARRMGKTSACNLFGALVGLAMPVIVVLDVPDIGRCIKLKAM